MTKKLLVLLIIVAIIITGSYLYLRYSVLKSKDYKPDLSKSKSVLDLRPALIAKLQQVVKDGSDGLYNLRIVQIEPSVINSTLQITGVVLTPDSSVLSQMDSLHNAPDDVFKISFKALHVDGIGIEDLLHGKKIDLTAVIIDEPVIEVFHKERFYNAGKRLQNDTITLYNKITKQLSSISVKNTSVKSGQVINHNLLKKDKVTRYNDVSFQLNDLLIDSSTQYDKSRFLFAKDATILLRKYSLRTPDSLYFFNCNAIHISAAIHQLTAEGTELVPRFGKDQFQQKTKGRQDRYSIKIPKLVLSGIDWWKLANYDELTARQADVYNLSFSDYLDRTEPAKKLVANNYPHQAIMKIQMPLAVQKVKLHDMALTYEEFNPASSKAGTLKFTAINGELQNLTNIPSKIKRNSFLTLNAKTLFMNKVPVTLAFKFNLAKVQTGSFSADVHAGAMDYTVLNPLAEPLGLFNLKSGNVKEATIHMYGDNFKVNSDFLLLYDNLYIIPLKKDEDAKGGLKKKKFTGILANFILIKDANPNKSGKVRQLQYSVERELHPNFFNQLWKTILYGIIKTIGAPAKLAK